MPLPNRLVLLALCLFMLTACPEEDGSGLMTGVNWGGLRAPLEQAGDDYAMMDGQNEAMAPAAELAANMTPASMALNRGTFGERKIAETHSLSVEVAPSELKARYQRDFAKCVELGCEILSSQINLPDNAHLNARIDPQQLPALLDAIGTGPGEIKNHQVAAEDKTYQVNDLSARIANQEALRDRLRALLGSDKAKTVTEIMEIERELTRVQSEIDAQTSQLRYLSRITTKATIHASYGVTSQPVEFNYHELKNSARVGWQQFVSNVAEVMVFVASMLPWIPVFFIMIWVLRLALRRSDHSAHPRRSRARRVRHSPVISDDSGDVDENSPFAQTLATLATQDADSQKDTKKDA